MIAKLDAKTPKPGRIWLLKQLERLGGEESVPALAAVLADKDDEIRDAATRALANNPSKKATGKLTDALGAARGKAKIGILNALGFRGDATAVQAIAHEIGASDEKAAIAAARALGRIPATESMFALAEARRQAKGAGHAAIGNALLAHADRLAKQKDSPKATASAAAIYRELETDASPAIRLAALRGTIQTSGDEGGNLVLEILNGTDASARAVAIGQIEGLSASALKPLAANLDKLTVPNRVLVITALGARGDRTQLPVALAAATSKEPAVKRAAILALGRLGDASTVEFLLDAMVGKDATAGIAAESLAALPVEGVNKKLIAVLDSEKTPARAIALIGILERRKAAALPSLLKAATGSDAGVRIAAFNALKSLASPKDMPAMIAALAKTQKGTERTQAEIVIAAVAAQLPAEKRAEAVLAEMSAARDRTADLLPLLGRLGGPDALKAVRTALANTDPAMHDAAIAGLCNWPDATPNDDLLKLAESGQSDAEKRRRAAGSYPHQHGNRLDSTHAGGTARRPGGDEEGDGPHDPRRRAAGDSQRHRFRPAHRDAALRAALSRRPETGSGGVQGSRGTGHSKMLREPNKAEFGKVLVRVIAICKDKGLVDRAQAVSGGTMSRYAKFLHCRCSLRIRQQCPHPPAPSPQGEAEQDPHAPRRRSAPLRVCGVARNAFRR